jgi:hypothetical protein
MFAAKLDKGPTMPLFYHGRLKGNDDSEWIKNCMRWVPTEEQQVIANEYSKRYLQGKTEGRKLANTWLHTIAKQHHEAYLKQKKATNDE